MWASRILRLARTRRWATAGSAMRNARATSAVVNPPTVRSVSATCASWLRAGWQQVKISRSRSGSSGSIGVLASCSSWSRSLLCVCSRRSWSSALRRAVVVTQAAALWGMPSAGQCSTAAMNASCRASSARSKSPKMRMSVARMRPYSSRNTRSTVCAAGPSRTCPTVSLPFPDGPHLDRAIRGVRDLAGPLDGLVEVVAFEDEQAAELLAGLGERTVRDQRLAVAHADRGGAGRWVKAGAVLQDPRLPDLRIEGAPGLVQLLVLRA